MIGKLHSYVLETADPLGLAAFYRSIVGGEIHTDGEDWVNLVLDGHTRLSFQLCANHVPPVWPGTAGEQQAHLDILVEDLDIAHEQLMELDIKFVDSQDGWRVYLDPAGHPFCTID